MKIHIKLSFLISLLTLLALLGGCSSDNDELYQSSIRKGLDAVAEDNFNKAEGLFEMATEAKNGDKFAHAYLNQVQLILEATILESEQKLDEALDLLEQSIKVTDGSKIINEKSKTRKNNILVSREQHTNYSSLLSSAKELNKASQYQQSNEKLAELLQGDLSQLDDFKNEVTALKEQNDTAIKKAEAVAAEKAAADAKAKELAALEAEAKRKAEEQENNPFAWNPGIKETFEQEMIEFGYVDPDGPFMYLDGYIGGDGDGYFSLHTIRDNLDVYVVVVNVKTGWFHG